MKKTSNGSKRLPRRLLSITLAAALVAGLVALGGIVPASATLSKTTASGPAGLVFYVPETIYLTPMANDNCSVFQYYADCDSAGTLDSSRAKTSGNIYFSLSGATGISITAVTDNGGASLNSLTPGSISGASDTASGAVTAGTLTTALAPNSGTYVCWKATYTYLGRSYTTYAYSYVFAPSQLVAGVAGRAATYNALASGSWVKLQSVMALMGFHGVGGGNRVANNTLRSDIIKGSRTASGNAAVESEYLTNPGSGIQYDDNEKTTSDGNAQPSLNTTENYINVDSSRYSDVNTVPGMLGAYVNTDSASTGKAGSMYINFQGSQIMSKNFGTSGNHNGLHWSWPTAISASLGTGLNTYTLYSYHNGQNTAAFGYTNAYNRMTFVFYANGINKATLRSAVKNAQRWSFSEGDQNTTLWATYRDALKNAYGCLGNPKEAQAGVDSAANALNNAVNALISGTATAQHYNRANSNALINTESTAYGNTSTPARESVTGTAYNASVTNTNWYYLDHYNTDSRGTNSATTTATSSTITKDYGTGAWGGQLYWNFYYYPIYDVVYNAGVYNPAPANVKSTYSISSQYLADGPVRTGYTFAGWQVSSGSTNASYPTGYVFSPAPNTVLPNTLRNDLGAVNLSTTWTANAYNVVYDPGPEGNFASGNGNRSVTYDAYYSAATGGIPTASRTGYTFNGWFTSKDANGNGTGTQIVADSTVVTNATLSDMVGNSPAATFYAKWTPVTYKVIFDHDGGTLDGLGATTPADVIYDTNYNAVIPAGLPSKLGWAFNGWWGGSGLSVPIVTNTTVDYNTIDAASLTNPATATTFKAKWNIATYQLIFEFEGGNIATDTGPRDLFGVTGVPMSVPAPAPVRTGYRFNGWWTEQDGFGTQLPGTFRLEDTNVLSAASIADPGVPTTYYAWWVPDVYSLIWNLDGGNWNGNPTPNPTTPSIAYDEAYVLPFPVPTRTGYTFGGWWTKQNGGGVQIQPPMTATSATLDPMSMLVQAVPTVFFAKWMYDGDYTVTYNLQGGNIATDTNPVSHTITLGDPFQDGTNIPAKPERTGYKFEGWFFTKADGTEEEIKDGVLLTGDLLSLESVANPAEPTVYNAKWAAVTYKVEFDDQNGTVTQADVVYDTDYVLPAQPARDGYVFEGWRTNNDGTGAQITNATVADYQTLIPGTVYPDVAATFYAHWTAIEYTLHYEGNGADGGALPLPVDQTVTYGSTTVPAAPIITLTGYDFVRWDVLDGNNGVATVAAGVSPGSTLSKTDGAIVTLKAIWAPSTNTAYEVHVFLADETNTYDTTPDTVDPLTGTTGAIAVANPVDYSDPLYVFDDTNTDNVLSGGITPDGSLVLELYYKRSKFQLTVNLDGGSGSESGLVGVFPWGYKKTLVAPVKQGYTFNGWVVDVATAGVAGAVVTQGKADTTATATWVPATNVAYAIEVYLEDENGNYPATASETMGKTGTTGAAVALSGTGSEWISTTANADAAYYDFVISLSDAGGTILADGSLKLKLYFTRKTYDLYADAANPANSPLKLGTYRWGEAVTLTQPTYAGYVFNIWTIDTGNNAGAGCQVVGDTVTVGKGGDTYVIADWTNASDTLYKIHVYLEDQPSGSYVFAETMTKSGTTGTVITLDGSEWPNAGSLYTYDQTETEAGAWTGSIAADGSLELDLYYKRVLVTLTASNNGGTGGSDGTLGTFPWGSEQALTQPAAPAGYAFGGWIVTAGGVYASVSGNTVTVGRDATAVQAQWIPAASSYTIEIYRENAAGAFVKASPDATRSGVTDTTAVANITEFVLDPDLYVFDAANSGNVLSGVIAANGTTVLKLYYKRALVTLTVDANGGTGGGLAGSFRWGDTQTISVPTAPAGMEFNGWEITAGGTGVGVSGNDVTLGQDDTVARAKWKASTANFQVEIWTQGADGLYSRTQTAIGPIFGQPDATTGDPYEINKAAYNPGTGYLNTGHGSDSINVASVEGDGSSTFILYYARHTVTLTVDLDGGTAGGFPGGVASPAPLWGQVIDLGANPTRGSYTFGGWMIVGGNGAGFIDAQLVVGTTDTTIKAKWFALPEYTTTYTVNIYLQQADGAYLSSPSTSYLSYSTTGIATANPGDWSDTNYTFDALHDFNNLSANIIDVNTTDSELKMYYARNTVNLTVDLAGGTAGVPDGIAEDTTPRLWGAAVTLGAEPTKAGCTFSHWTVISGAGAGIDSGVFSLGVANTTIKANWIQNPDVIYTVEIYLMDAVGIYGAAVQTVKKSAQAGAGNATASGTDWSGAGYVFDSAAANVLAADLAPNGTTSVQLKLYYARTAGNFDVWNGGSNTVTDPGNLVWGSVIYLDNTPSRPGYQFVCWQHVSGTGSLSGNRLTVGEDDIVQALWIADSVINGANYKVYIYLMDASGNYPATADTFVMKTGVAGAGNAASAAGDWSGAGYVYDSGAGTADLAITGVTTPVLELYYERTTVDLTVNLNGGTGGTASQTGLLWGQQLTLTNPTRTGYTFSYWRVTAGDGAGITAGDTLIMGTTNTSIEAVWTDDNAGGNSGGTTTIGGCNIPNWLLPFVHVGTFMLGFGAGWFTRAVTMPWWLIVLMVILGLFLFPLFWWIIL